MAKRTGTILVVDDEPDVCEMIELGLSSDGYRVLTAEGGQGAIDLVRNQAIDLLITDFKMPGMNGIDVATSLREMAPDLPVIVVTGYMAEGMLDNYSELEKVEVIRKPFAFETLVQAVEGALGEG